MTSGRAIDLNADLGEGFGSWRMGDDAALLEIVSSANVACGFHAGDPSIMRRTCERAVAAGVAIGAHIGYRDLAGFGRRDVDAAPADLHDEALYQVGALQACARAAGASVHYVKPHGALYHRCSTDAAAAEAVVSALQALEGGLQVVGAPRSELLRAAQAAGLGAVAEGFADRAYDPHGRLVARSQEHALLEHDAAVSQALAIAGERTVRAIDGRVIDLDVRTLCVHGDSPGAVRLARTLREALEHAGVRVEAFA